MMKMLSPLPDDPAALVGRIVRIAAGTVGDRQISRRLLVEQILPAEPGEPWFDIPPQPVRVLGREVSESGRPMGADSEPLDRVVAVEGEA